MIKLTSRTVYLITSVVVFVQCVVFYVLYVKLNHSGSNVAAYVAVLPERLDDVSKGYLRRGQPVWKLNETNDIDIVTRGLELQTNYTRASIQTEDNDDRGVYLHGMEQRLEILRNQRHTNNWTSVERNIRTESDNRRSQTIHVKQTVQSMPRADDTTRTAYRMVWFTLTGSLKQRMKNNVNFTQCEYKGCSLEFMRVQITDDNMTIPEADAIIFQGNQILPKHPPRRDSSRQVFVFYDMESPPYVHSPVYKTPPWRGVFNWTLTYRTDSDLFMPYGIPIRRQPSDLYMPPAHYSSIFQKKTETAFWIVSHCPAQSRREQYAERLSQYIDVDTFGMCGVSDECYRRNNSNCLPDFATRYKFYLAFENNLCEDYITEKFYKILELDTIAVVRGGADYRSLVPAGTYINAADFDSVKQLADYLKEVGSSEEKYTSFLKAKREYSGSRVAYQRTFCELCRRLRDVERYRRSYTDIGHWWTNGMCHAITDLI